MCTTGFTDCVDIIAYKYLEVTLLWLMTDRCHLDFRLRSHQEHTKLPAEIMTSSTSSLPNLNCINIIQYCTFWDKITKFSECQYFRICCKVYEKNNALFDPSSAHHDIISSKYRTNVSYFSCGDNFRRYTTTPA